MTAPDPGFGLYIHWPFCLSKCPYCDFNSHVRAAFDEPRFCRALVAALARLAVRAPDRCVTSVFFGGGTPSLMASATVAAILEAAGRFFPLADDLEVTLEANPTSVEAGRFREFRAAGINRVSIGVQALENDALQFLGRRHTVAEALDAVALAVATFPRASFDLIYARPGQTEAQWAQELTRALALGPQHLSLYQLTYEPGTPFGDLHARGRLGALGDDAAASLYEATQAMCEAAGLPAYEVSNHARPGAECRHNLLYWRYGDYLGIGPGAHGRISGRATTALRSPEAWLADVEAGGAGLDSDVPLAPGDQAQEYLLMSLRLSEGTRPARYQALGGALDPARVAMLADEGLLARADDRLHVTAKGRLVLNSIIAALAA